MKNMIYSWPKMKKPIHSWPNRIHSSTKMKKMIHHFSNDNKGLVDVEIQHVKDSNNDIHKVGIDNIPAILFKKGDKRIASHEGLISVSVLQKKINLLLNGGTLSDSSNIGSIKNLKQINKKELYNIGEYLLFYFVELLANFLKLTFAGTRGAWLDY